MSTQITTALVNQFRSAFDLQFQQEGSRLGASVRNEMQRGEFAFYDQITPTAVAKRTTRHGDSPLTSNPHSRRRVGIEDYEEGDMVDAQDLIRTLGDPTSAYVQNMVWAHGRAMDDEIIRAFDATAYTGKAGGTSTVFDTTYSIATTYVESGAAVASNLPIAKLRKAKQLLDGQEVPESDRFLAVTSNQVKSLLTQTEITSGDYNIKTLPSGQVTSFLGFNLVRTERLTVASSVRACFAYWRNAMLLAKGEDIMVRVAERPDKSFSTYAYTRSTFGATRMWENGIIRIYCDETKP